MPPITLGLLLSRISMHIHSRYNRYNTYHTHTTSLLHHAFPPNTRNTLHHIATWRQLPKSSSSRRGASVPWSGTGTSAPHEKKEVNRNGSLKLPEAVPFNHGLSPNHHKDLTSAFHISAAKSLCLWVRHSSLMCPSFVVKQAPWQIFRLTLQQLFLRQSVTLLETKIVLQTP